MIFIQKIFKILTKNYLALLCFLTFLAVLIFSLKGVYGDDVWFHLATGRFVFQNRQIPTKDVFSFTRPGEKWVNQGWLANLVFYLVYEGVGWVGFGLFDTLLSLATFWLLFKILRRLGVNERLSLLLVFWAAFIAALRFQARPEIGSYPLLMLTLWLLVNFGKQKRILFLPLVFLFWANWQAGFVPFGLYCAGAFCLREFLLLLQDGWGRGIINFFKKPLFWATLLSLPVTLINPNGLDGATYFLQVQPKVLYSDFTEWGTLVRWLKEGRATVVEEYLLNRGYLVCLGVLLIFLVWWFIKHQRIKYITWILEDGFWLWWALPFVFSPFYGNRFSSLAVIFISIILGVFSRNWEDFEKIFFNKKTTIVIIVVCLISFGLREAAYPPTPNTYHKSFFYRDEVIDFLHKENIKGPMFNVLEDGGYFMWKDPDRKVFMDGRLDIYTGSGLYDEYKIVYNFPPQQGWQEVLEKYQIEFLLLPGWQKDIMATIRASGKYDLVYWGDYLFILIKNDGLNRKFAQEHAIRFAQPFREEDYPDADLDKVIAEYEQLKSLSPRASSVRISLAAAYQQKKENDKAIAEYEEALKIKPEEGQARLALGALYSLRKDCPSAIKEFEIARKNQSLMIKTIADRNLGYVYLDCAGDRVLAYYYFKEFLSLAKKRGLSPNDQLVAEIENLVRSLERQGRKGR